jgi:hypothetical protein
LDGRENFFLWDRIGWAHAVLGDVQVAPKSVHPDEHIMWNKHLVVEKFYSMVVLWHVLIPPIFCFENC